MGIAQLGSRLGTAIFPAFVQFMILFIGWRLAWTGLGITVFLLSAIPALLFLKRRPEDMGLLPDGESPIPRDVSQVIKEVKDKKNQAAGSNQEANFTRKQVIRQSSFWFLILISSFLVFGGGGANFHFYPFVTDNGISAATAVSLLSIAAISSAGGGLFLGMLTERFSAKLILSFVMTLLAIMFFFIFWIVTIRPALYMFAVIFGVLRGGAIPLIPLIWAEFYGRESLGSIFSLSGPFRFTANALGPVFAGLCFDLLGNYHVPFTIFSFLFLISGIISYFMPGKGPRNQIPVPKK
jgi:cyanate permease